MYLNHIQSNSQTTVTNSFFVVAQCTHIHLLGRWKQNIYISVNESKLETGVCNFPISWPNERKLFQLSLFCALFSFLLFFFPLVIHVICYSLEHCAKTRFTVSKKNIIIQVKGSLINLQAIQLSVKFLLQMTSDIRRIL